MNAKVKGYEEGFEYGETCARRMTRERRMDNAAFVRASEHFKWDRSPTHDFWRGYVSAMETSLF